MEEPEEIGSWKKVSVLGTGGFGTVTHWRCEKTKQNIAIKKCKKRSECLTHKQKKRWIKEVSIIQGINHPNIISFVQIPIEFKNAINQSGLPILSMEYCNKGNLRRVLLDPINRCGLKENTIKSILSDISSAIKHLHENNITHRDIKPENIVLQECNSRKSKIIYKIIDLGYAKEWGDATISFVGTLYYLAPEIFAGVTYNYCVDYWSLGVLSFEIICGEMPFLKTLNNFERFQFLKEKEKDDICIYKNLSGNIKFSKNLFKENYISPLFQNDIEIWLRKALQFDPIKRSKYFESNESFFDRLKTILAKKYINVFCVFLCKYFAYDLNNVKGYSDLKQCIEQDSGILLEDQILVCSEDVLQVELSVQEIKLFNQEEPWVYVFSKNNLFYGEVSKDIIPRKIKFLFDNITESKFNNDDLKEIAIHSIYFINKNLQEATRISKAIFYLRKTFQFHLNLCIDKNASIAEEIKDVLNQITDFEKYKKNNKPKDKQILNAKKCLLNYDKILSSLEKFFKTKLECDNYVNRLCNRKHLLEDMFPQICEMINLLHVHDLLKKATNVFLSCENDQGSSSNTCNDIFKIVNQAIKLHDTMLRNEDLKAYAVFLLNLIGKTEHLYDWINNHFEPQLNQTKQSLDNTIQNYESCVENLFNDNTGNLYPNLQSINMTSLNNSIKSFPESFVDQVLLKSDTTRKSGTNFVEEHKRFCDDILLSIQNLE